MNTIWDYVEFLLYHSDLSEREKARAYLYADRYGMGLRAVIGDDIASGAVFAEPACGDPDCVNPAHQRLERPAEATR